MAAVPGPPGPPQAPAPPADAVAAAAARLRRSITAFGRLQKYSQQKFHLYRNGDADFYLSIGSLRALRQAGQPDLWNRMIARQIPRGSYRGTFSDLDRVALQDIADQRQQYFGDQRPLPGMARRGIDAARQEVKRAGQIMNNTFRFIRYLGNGGQGMVSLWEYRPGPRQVHRLVLKVSTATKPGPGPSPKPVPDTAQVEREKDFMTRLLRAPHILQRFVFQDNLPQTRSRRVGAGNQGMAEALDNDDGLLFMEYARFGDVDKLLNKAAAAALDGGQLPFPVPTVWRFFDCLVKGCISMDYPPREVPANIPNNVDPGAPAPTAGANLPETIPPGGLDGNVPGHAGIVHFDLDPTNVFVADYDQPGQNALVPAHTDAPRLQIADFGLAETAGDLWAPAAPIGSTALQTVRNRFEMWGRRGMAKPHWYLPEQFSVDWDAVPLDPSSQSPQAPNWPPWAPWPITSGPGRYTHRSNVWQMGMVMYCLTTLEKPQFPPVAGRLTQDEPGGIPYALVPSDQQRWTYGFKLVDPDPTNMQSRVWQARYGTHLCEVVARCLMNRQEHRPSLQQLQNWTTTAMTPPPGGGDPPGGSTATAAYAGWKVVMFGNPPPPSVSWRLARTGINNSDVDPFWDYRTGQPVRLN